MIKKSADLVIIPATDNALDFVLREGGVAPNAEARHQLSTLLKALEDHRLNKQGKAKPSIVIPSVNVHFRLVPTLYAAAITTIGVAVAIATLPVNPLIAAGTGVLTVANAIEKVTKLFKKLSAQEIAVVNALCSAINKRRKSDPKAKDATAKQVTAAFKGSSRTVEWTLKRLANNNVLSESERDGDIYYTLRY